MQAVSTVMQHTVNLENNIIGLDFLAWNILVLSASLQCHQECFGVEIAVAPEARHAVVVDHVERLITLNLLLWGQAYTFWYLHCLSKIGFCYATVIC